MKKPHFPPVFSVAEAQAHGRTPEQIRRGTHVRLFCGVYADSQQEHTLAQKLSALTSTLPNVAITSFSAARLMGWRIPWRYEDTESTYAISLHGKQVQREKISVAKEQIFHLIQRYPGMRGVARWRQALEKAVTGSDSLMETELRLMLNRYGITNLTCNVPVYSDLGILLFEPDLAIERLKISIQYEGVHHGGRDQIRTDVNRARKAHTAGWIEVRLFFEDLREKEYFQGELVPRAVKLVKEAILQRASGGF